VDDYEDIEDDMPIEEPPEDISKYPSVSEMRELLGGDDDDAHDDELGVSSNLIKRENDG